VHANVLAGGPGNHLVVFYPEDRELIGTVGEFLREGLDDGGSAIVVATAAHRLALDAWLGCAGVDAGAAMAAGTYVELDAAETLAQFMINDRADPAAFWEVISPLLQQAGAGGKRVLVYGEMVALLWAAGNVGTAIDLEALWNEMGARFPFVLLCGYPAQSMAEPEHADAVAQVCSAHTATIGQPA
jgi:MEDS: MEthanogen/methylotroph, DcmR Sensory domain